MTPTSPSLADGNRLQRRYWRWAERHYARFDAPTREQAIAIDAFLYSRRGIGFWLGLLTAMVGSAVGLTLAGVPVLLAVAGSLLVWSVLPLVGLTAWIAPGAFVRRYALGKTLVLAGALALLGGLLGFVVGHVARHGRLDPALLGRELVARFFVLAPAVLAVGLGIVAALFALATVRKQVLERQLERLQMQRERDAAAHRAAEAQLKLLQGQIQPHFIFNTLAALQHWVDTGDARAGPLLRELTLFLRGSTELLGRARTTLADEAAMVSHYLTIMQARLGQRLRWQVEIDPDLADQSLPPGLLLTLVENAVEHGISPLPAGGPVQVRAQRAGSAWQMRVADGGAGLAEGWQEGLGLSNCRQRLQHHFGDQARLTLSAALPGTLACITVEGPGAP